MTTTLSDQLAELAATLNDLRRRLRQAVRDQVARAVGEALRELALAAIAGPLPAPAAARGLPGLGRTVSGGRRGSWYPAVSVPEEIPSDDGDPAEAPPLPSAVLAGLWAASWALARIRQLPTALALGLVVSLAAYVGGKAVAALLEVWSAANDLPNYPGTDRRP